MFGSEILDVAIGLIFVFLLASLLCSAIRELAEGWFKTRAVFLEQGLRQLLHDPTGEQLVRALYRHPSVYGLFKGDYDPGTATQRGVFARTNLPAYIPASNFAVAMLDLATRGLDVGAAADGESPRISIANVRAGVARIPAPEVRRALLSAVDLAEGDLARAQKNVQAWYDATMDRVSGWYKRRTQVWLFALGLATAFGLNLNTVAIARQLYHDQSARATLVAGATGAARDPSPSGASVGDLIARADQLGIPVGWPRGWAGGVAAVRPGDPAPPVGAADVALAALGWLTTALAVSLGAPFWFDLLNKVMVVRSTVKPHEKSPEEASDDRQPAAPRARTAAELAPADAPAPTPRAPTDPHPIPDVRELARLLPDQPTLAP